MNKLLFNDLHQQQQQQYKVMLKESERATGISRNMENKRERERVIERE